MIFLVGAVWALGVVTLDLKLSLFITLGVLTAFVVLFALWTVVVLQARKSDVFAVTAAYAAVLVVFVGLSARSGP